MVQNSPNSIHSVAEVGKIMWGPKSANSKLGR